MKLIMPKVEPQQQKATVIFVQAPKPQPVLADAPRPQPVSADAFLTSANAGNLVVQRTLTISGMKECKKELPEFADSGFHSVESSPGPSLHSRTRE
jgi:hypothetical protein